MILHRTVFSPSHLVTYGIVIFCLLCALRGKKLDKRESVWGNRKELVTLQFAHMLSCIFWYSWSDSLREVKGQNNRPGWNWLRWGLTSFSPAAFPVNLRLPKPNSRVLRRHPAPQFLASAFSTLMASDICQSREATCFFGHVLLKHCILVTQKHGSRPDSTCTGREHRLGFVASWQAKGRMTGFC